MILEIVGDRTPTKATTMLSPAIMDNLPNNTYEEL
jgi:hypothetical protein